MYRVGRKESWRNGAEEEQEITSRKIKNCDHQDKYELLQS